MKKLLTILYVIIVIEVLCIATLSAFGGFQQKPMLGEQVNKAHQLGDFVGAWFMQEGSGNKVYDLSGNGNTGTLTGTAPSWTSGKFGSAILLPGDDEYVAYGNIEAFANLTQLTYMAWVYHNTIDDDDIIIYNYAPNKGFSLTRDDAGGDTARTDMYKPFIKDAGGDTASIEGATNSSPLQEWTHVAVTFIAANANGLRLYINGVEDENSPVSTIDLSDAGGSGVDFYIGAYSGGLNFNGQIGHVLIYNRALTASEIALLYREPFCMFERDDVALMAKAAEAPPGVSIPVMYYHYVFHSKAYIFLPIIPVGIYYLRRRKCAA